MILCQHGFANDIPAASIKNMLDPWKQWEMAYRGHDDTDKLLNAEKWKEFIKVMPRSNPKFHQLHSWLSQTYKVYNYTSK